MFQTFTTSSGVKGFSMLVLNISSPKITTANADQIHTKMTSSQKQQKSNLIQKLRACTIACQIENNFTPFHTECD